MRLERYVAVSPGRWKMTCWVTLLPTGRAEIKESWLQRAVYYSCTARSTPVYLNGASEESWLVSACRVATNLRHLVTSKSPQWILRALWYVVFLYLFFCI